MELRKQWLAVLRVLRNISLLAFRFFSLASGSLISAARLYFKSQTQKASVKKRPKLCVMWLLGAFRYWIGASCESWIWRWPAGLLRFSQCVMSRQEWVKVAARCHVWCSLLFFSYKAHEVHHCSSIGVAAVEPTAPRVQNLKKVPDFLNVLKSTRPLIRLEAQHGISNPCWNIMKYRCVYLVYLVCHGFSHGDTEWWASYLTG